MDWEDDTDCANADDDNMGFMNSLKDFDRWDAQSKKMQLWAAQKHEDGVSRIERARKRKAEFQITQDIEDLGDLKELLAACGIPERELGDVTLEEAQKKADSVLYDLDQAVKKQPVQRVGQPTTFDYEYEESEENVLHVLVRSSFTNLSNAQGDQQDQPGSQAMHGLI